MTMALRNILQEGEERLRKKSRPVEIIDERILTLLEDMAETMYDSNGVGLAAPQVGILRQAVVIDIGEGLIELINPEIIEEEGVQTGEEACLSVPGIVAIVDRPKKVKVKALNRHGEEIIYEGEDFLAKAFCHEIDHLKGILFIDHPHRIVPAEGEDGEQQ